MSIVYGSFGQILNKTVNSGPLSSANIVYFSVPWSNSGVIRDIKLISPTGVTPGSGVSVYVAYNNAHTLAGETGIVGVAFTSHYMWAAIGLSVATGANGIFLNNTSFTGTGDLSVYTDDPYNRNYLHVKAVIPGGFSLPLKLQIAGQKLYPDTYIQTDKTSVTYLPDYSVVVGRNQSGANGTGGTTFDQTDFARQTAQNSDRNEFYINNANDYIYVGSTKKITLWDFKVGTPSTTIGVLQGQLWNSVNNAWENFRVLDNTASSNANTLRFSGLVEGLGIGSSNWGPTKLDSTLNSALTDDPATILERAILTGNHPPVGMFYNPSRYWVRFKVASITGRVDLGGILPVDSPY